MKEITADSLKEFSSIKNRILRLCKKVAKKGNKSLYINKHYSEHQELFIELADSKDVYNILEEIRLLGFIVEFDYSFLEIKWE